MLVDYIQLLHGDKKGYREQEVSSISRHQKELSKKLNSPVIDLSQLSRDVEKRRGNKRPLLSDLRESSRLEQDADCIVFLWSGEYDDGTPIADTVLFDVAKHRNGPTKSITVAFQGHYSRFTDMQL